MTTPDNGLLELAACPFCGGRAHSTKEIESANMAALVMCTDNDCATISGRTLAEAVTRWNTRALSAECGVKVKALEWRDHRPDSFPEPAWSAQTPFGFYNIEEVSASDSPRYVVRLHAHHFVADKDGLPEAKEAAQSDFDQRIRSALAPGVGEPVREEVMRLLREDFDPHPNYELPAGQWDDNADDVADKIIAAVLSTSTIHVTDTWRVLKKWLAAYADEEANFSRYRNDVMLDGVMTAQQRRQLWAIVNAGSTAASAPPSAAVREALEEALDRMKMAVDWWNKGGHALPQMSAAIEMAEAALGLGESSTSSDGLCSDCPPVGYETDRTRCAPCPRRTDITTAEDRERIAREVADRVVAMVISRRADGVSVIEISDAVADAILSTGAVR